MNFVIGRLYFDAFVLSAMSVIYINVLVRKKRIIKWEQAPADTSSFIKKNEKKINGILKVIIGIGCLFGNVYLVIPSLLDLPSVINQDYEIVSGTVDSWNYSDEERVKFRGVRIESSDYGEMVWVNVFDKGIHKGDYLVVMYLPHSKYGKIQRKIDHSEGSGT